MLTISPRLWPLWTHGAVSVNLAGGNLVTSAPGPWYPTKVGSLSLSATYYSQDPTSGPPLGSGCTLNVGDGSPPSQLTDVTASGGGETAAEAPLFSLTVARDGSR